MAGERYTAAQVAPWGDELAASLAGNAAQATGADPTSFVMGAIASEPSTHPALGGAAGTNWVTGEPLGSAPILDAIASVPGIVNDTIGWGAAKKLFDTRPGGPSDPHRDPSVAPSLWYRDPLIILIGVGVLLVGVFALSQTGPGRVIVTGAKRAAGGA